MLNVSRHHGMLGTTALVALAACTALSSPAHAKSWLEMDEKTEQAGGWTIGYSSGFAGCLAATRQADETNVWFGYSLKRKYFVAMVNPAWQAVKHGTLYRLTMQFPSAGKWHAQFVGFKFGNAKGVATWNLKESFVQEIAGRSRLNLSASGAQMASVSLRGTRNALEAILRCQNKFHDRALADAARKEPRKQAKRGGHSDPGTTTPEKPPQQRKATTSTGTGFFVTRKGHIVTNNHVTAKCTMLQVSYGGGPLVRATLLASDTRNDLALIKTDLKPQVVPTIKPRVRVGDDVYVYGFPLSGLLSKTGNFTVGYVTAAAGLADDTTKLQISAQIQPGNSGGPLMDSYGNVVGVIVSKLNVLRVAKLIKDVPQNVNFAIKSSLAISFLEANGIYPADGHDNAPAGAGGAGSPDKMSPADIAARARKHTVHIICRRGPTS